MYGKPLAARSPAVCRAFRRRGSRRGRQEKESGLTRRAEKPATTHIQILWLFATPPVGCGTTLFPTRGSPSATKTPEIPTPETSNRRYTRQSVQLRYAVGRNFHCLQKH